MIARAMAVAVPFRWVAGDTVYGVGEIERDLRRAGKGYVLGVDAAHIFRSWDKPRRIAGTAEKIAKALAAIRLEALVGGRGNQGPTACMTGAISNSPTSRPKSSTKTGHGLWTRGLLIRRNIADGDLAYFTTWCPAGTSIDTLVSVEGHRWAIEDSFETAKNEFGLDHNETRSWHGWHRHVSLVMLAFAMMAAIRHQANRSQANQPAPKKTKRAATTNRPTLIRWSVQEIRRIAQRLAQRRIDPAYVIAWSLWRRAHQAAAQKSHIKRKSQL